jgi:Ni/Co efflux regulator RcnB
MTAARTLRPSKGETSMRKLILLTAAAAVIVPSIAVAQPQEIRHDRREIRQDRHELRQDRRELRRDRRDIRRHVAYVAPYRGWSYRPVTVGYRYGDDLLLVNIRTGRVLQVMHYRWW